MGGLSMQPWGKGQIILMKLPVPKMKGKKRYASHTCEGMRGMNMPGTKKDQEKQIPTSMQ